jgi:hypothetical protein
MASSDHLLELIQSKPDIRGLAGPTSSASMKAAGAQ